MAEKLFIKENLNEKILTLFEGHLRGIFAMKISRFTKEVSERGDFVNILTSDLLAKGDQFIFMNHLRRIDGTEFDFMSDPQNTVNVANHFIGRLLELDKNPKGKIALSNHKKELSL